MLLYTHATNDARELRGDTPVNSLWLWGEQGADSPAPTLPQRPLYADSPLYQALARASGSHAEAVPYQFRDSPPQDILIVLDALEAPAQFRDAFAQARQRPAQGMDVHGRLLAAMKAGQLQALALSCDGEAGFTLQLQRRQLWKFWQAGKPLSELYPQ